MRNVRIDLRVLVLVAVGCASRMAAPPPVPPQPPVPVASAPPAPPTPVTSAATSALVDAGAPEPSPPKPVVRTGKVWPFHTWTRAEAVTFNRFVIDSGSIPLVAYGEQGWSKHIAKRKWIVDPLARKAFDLVKQTEGEVAISKCPFPRHAVVLYDGDDPVASINVCFECGDIVLWPRWRGEWETMTEMEQKDSLIRASSKEKLHRVVFPKWKTFFASDVGYRVDETWH